MNMRGCPADDDDAAADQARVDQARRELRTMRLVALASVRIGRQLDRTTLSQLRRTDRERWTDEQETALERLAWRYRKLIARHLAPAMPPDDPIVRAMKAREMQHG